MSYPKGKKGLNYKDLEYPEIDWILEEQLTKNISDFIKRDVWEGIYPAVNLKDGTIAIMWRDCEMMHFSLEQAIRIDLGFIMSDLDNDDYRDSVELKRLKIIHTLIGKLIARIEQGPDES